MDKITGITGVQFFGQMTASISHEIRNRMAVINEQAGLLQDFILLAGKGKPLDPERLDRLGATIRNQVAKADIIIETMNRFSHYVDKIIIPIHGNALLATMASLVDRLVGIRGFKLKVIPAAGDETITTAPFLLMNLIWLCLEATMKGADAGSSITLDCRPVADGVEIRISGSGDAKKCLEALDTEEVDALKTILGASLVERGHAFGFVIHLPPSLIKSDEAC